MMKKKKVITLDIKKWGINGEGIGYYKRKPVFTENAIPNEKVEAEIIEEKDTFVKARTLKVLEPSSRRRHAVCPLWNECGGCPLSHVQYKEQVKMKTQLLKEALKKYAGYTGPILPIIKNPDPLAYRNALKLPVQSVDGKLCAGFYKKESSDFVPASRCLIHTKALEACKNAVLEVLNQYHLQAYNPKTDTGIRSLVLREVQGKIQLTLVTGKDTIPPSVVDDLMKIEGMTSIWQSMKEADSSRVQIFGDVMNHLAGEKNLTMHAGRFVLQLLPRSFYQLNTRQAEALYELAADWIPECRTLVEAYSGVGAISLYAAEKADRVIGIENIPDAVINANENAIANGVENVHFICGDAGEELEKLEKEEEIDVLVVDPPRSGLDQKMIHAILESRIKTILYISCNPATLAKNLKDLESSYTIKRVQPVDIFSQTPHVETVVLMTRRDT